MVDASAELTEEKDINKLLPSFFTTAGGGGGEVRGCNDGGGGGDVWYIRFDGCVGTVNC